LHQPPLGELRPNCSCPLSSAAPRRRRGRAAVPEAAVPTGRRRGGRPPAAMRHRSHVSPLPVIPRGRAGRGPQSGMESTQWRCRVRLLVGAVAGRSGGVRYRTVGRRSRIHAKLRQQRGAHHRWARPLYTGDDEEGVQCAMRKTARERTVVGAHVPVKRASCLPAVVNKRGKRAQHVGKQ